MKVRFFAATALAAAVISTPAAAQEVVMSLTGEVDQICGAFDFQEQPVLIDFGTLSNVPVGSQTPEQVNNVSIVCNDAAGGTVTVTSANNGLLFRDGTSGGSGNQVGYTVRATGGNGLAFDATTLTTPVSRPFNGSTAFIAGSGLTLRFAANGVLEENVGSVNGADRTTVFAGTYTDTVTVAVTAN